jgi:hypothetical protein
MKALLLALGVMLGLAPQAPPDVTVTLVRWPFT